MNAETSETKVGNEIKAWVLYDGDYRFCVDLSRRVRGLLEARGFEVLPLQTRGMRERLGLKPEELLAEMRVLTVQGKSFGGADAVIELARQVWWAWPFHALAKLPGAKLMLRAGYRWIAQRRNCSNGACGVAVGVSPAVEGGILPHRAAWECDWQHHFWDCSAGQDARLYGRRDACRHGGSAP